MEKREPISKKLRFEIFKRDAFTCQYCGKTPPSVILEVDHIHPVKHGGKNHDNLLTACFDCNRGKGGDLLTSIPQTVVDKTSIMAEKEAQITAYNKVLKAKRKREDAQIDQIESAFESHFQEYYFNPKFREDIRQCFLPYLVQDDFFMAINKGCARFPRQPEKALKYFCGICWNIRRAHDSDAAERS